jgi:hypothetical protein
MEGILTFIRELDECGYPGAKIAQTLKEVYDGSVGFYELAFPIPRHEQDHLLLEFQFEFYPAEKFELLGVAACIWSERLNQFRRPLAERENIWQVFEGLPTIEKVLNAFEQQQEELRFAPQSLTLKSIDMNLNNLENLKEELKMLHFDDKVAAQMEENMLKNLPEFTLRSRVEGNKGQVDMLLHFKQSNQSEHYYLNKYDVTLNKAKPLEEGQKYLIISPGQEEGKNLVRSFPVPHEAIAFFKAQEGQSKSELAVGKDAKSKVTLATIESGKINYVAKDFSKTYYSPVVDQTFYVERGNGFTSEQAANMIQGRAVFRDNMLNSGGIPYQAWIKLDMDRPKDHNGNYLTNQYHVPSYGFDLKETLEKYNIKEMADPGKTQAIMETLQNGNRPLITTVKDGEEVKLHVEAVPRYSQVNFYQASGKHEKREQFELAAHKVQEMAAGKGKAKEQETEMAMQR